MTMQQVAFDQQVKACLDEKSPNYKLLFLFLGTKSHKGLIYISGSLWPLHHYLFFLFLEEFYSTSIPQNIFKHGKVTILLTTYHMDLILKLFNSKNNIVHKTPSHF